MATLINPRFTSWPRQFSDDDDTASSSAPEYHFDGYTIEVSQKITLTPITPRHHGHHHHRDQAAGAK
jgi:hypothetical protein